MTADPQSPIPAPSGPPSPLIILFDGSCGMCNRAIAFLLKRDPAGRFGFTPRQSQAGQDLLNKHGLDAEKIQSVVLIDGERVYTKSDAVLRIVLEMPEPWPLLAVLAFVPARLRDDAYDFMARHRHQWFKPTQECRSQTAPGPERSGA